MERRLGNVLGGDNTIANLKAQIGQLRRQLEKYEGKGAKEARRQGGAIR